MNLEGEVNVSIYNNEKVNNMFSVTTFFLIIAAVIYIFYKTYEYRTILGIQLSEYLQRTKLSLNNIEINKDLTGETYIKVKYD
ncbi:MAG: hypothetical protein EB127_29750 [Alphaproteobacteria bacterium]|nr:hypothetical protein [Alphaproteobacteria bacterium]